MAREKTEAEAFRELAVDSIESLTRYVNDELNSASLANLDTVLGLNSRGIRIEKIVVRLSSYLKALKAEAEELKSIEARRNA